MNEFTADDSLTPRQRIKVRSISRIGAKALMDKTFPMFRPCPIHFGMLSLKTGKISRNVTI